MSDLISDHHRALYEKYYATREVVRGVNRWQKEVEDLAESIGAQSVIDYGCGPAATLSASTKVAVRNYDPAVVSFSSVPERADLVVCLHVLEHVEQDRIDNVLDHLRSLAIKAVFVAVSTQPSTKILPDGSPWHSFVKDERWWRSKLADYSELPPMQPGKEYVALLIL